MSRLKRSEVWTWRGGVPQGEPRFSPEGFPSATMLLPRQQQKGSHGLRRPGSPAGRQGEQTGCGGRRCVRLPPRRWDRLGPARHRRQSDLRCVRQRETRSELHWVRQRECPRNCQLSACLQFTFQRSDAGYTLANRPTPVETKEKLLLTDGRERWLVVGSLCSFPL